MLNEKQFNKVIKTLKGIDSKLDILIRLQRAGLPKTKIGEEEKKVLKLCDGKHTIEDIMNETGKKQGNIYVVLSNLRKKVLIRSIRKEGKTVYEII